ncbi:YlbF family regulator [Saccharibacillus sp. JS10]|uniref:YlbF family regulator n=1 Tax=Saccharibacillus sp. JS10 TaxID=2950552 RepID=UPI002109FAAB|nr:YlbF family regulator [Saccharibacillus sp. JS10]MCQ4086923.1 YlbF family regulator [Saccharibacillus sp. JS10]
MTNVYDQANELAKSLQESQEVQDITAALKLIEADPESKRMLDDFRTRQMNIQQRVMSGEVPPQDEMEQMEKLFEVLSLNLNIRRLFESEQRLSVIIQDVNKIISDSLANMYDPL